MERAFLSREPGIEGRVPSGLRPRELRKVFGLADVEGDFLRAQPRVESGVGGVLGCVQGVVRRVGDSMERRVRRIERVMESSSMPRIEKCMDCCFDGGINPKLIVKGFMEIHAEQVV